MNITRVRSNLSQRTFQTLVLNMRQNTQPLYEYLVYLCMLLIIENPVSDKSALNLTPKS